MKYSIAAAAVIGLVAAMPAADNEWESWSTTTTTTASSEWETWTTTTTTTKAAEWTTWKAPEPTCYSTSTYKTKDCDGGKDEWGNCKEVEKTTTYYDDKYCSTWAPVTIKTPEPEWNTWKAPKPTCYTASVYTTKECGSDEKKWDNCKDVTKTTTVYDDKYCTTWAPVTIKTPEAETTWAPATIKTPEAATTWATWAKSSTVSAPVAKWTGAADKQAVGMGAIAVAALAAFL